MKVFTKRKGVSAMAMGIALATGTMAVTSVLPADAHAQRAPKRDKKPKKGKQEKTDRNISDSFLALVTEATSKSQAEGATRAALKPQMDQMVAQASTGDEKFEAGVFFYNFGIKLGDPALRLDGLEMMVNSGSAPADRVAAFAENAFELAVQAKENARARAMLSRLINGEFGAGARRSPDALHAAMAEAYFADKMYAEGLDHLSKGIAIQKAAGQSVDERWYRRGLSVAYTNRVNPQLFDFVSAWVADFPSESNWRDAISITIQRHNATDGSILDLLRLADQVGSLNREEEFYAYIEEAGGTLTVVPAEVKAVINKGVAAGVLDQNDPLVSEVLRAANKRIAEDRAGGLAELEADVNSSDVNAKLLLSAGDTFLSYKEFAKAEAAFTRALNLPGVDKGRALTGVGMAQVALGQFDDAKATFAKVEGSRKPVAELWAAYADDQSAAPATVAATGS